MIGPLIGADDVCEAVEATLRLWLPSVLDEQEASGRPRLSDPATFEQLPDEAASTSAKFPAVIVSSPGLTGQPMFHGDGTADAVWSVVVSVITRGAGYRDTASTVRRYCTALRTTLTQHSDLGGLAEYTLWLDESYARLPNEVARSMAMGHVGFAVKVPAVLNVLLGPDSPPASGATTPDYPTVLDASETVLKES